MKKCTIVSVAVILLVLVAVGVTRPDFFDPLCRLGGITNTVYAPGFSRLKFSRITVGMPRSEVEARLGRGFEDFNAPSTTAPGSSDQSRWFYSAGAGNHWRFWIRFDEKDRVSQIQREFWWD